MWGARMFCLWDWRGARWPSSLWLGPFPASSSVPAGLDGSCVPGSGCPDGEGTSSHH